MGALFVTRTPFLQIVPLVITGTLSIFLTRSHRVAHRSQDRIRTYVMRCVFLSGLIPCYTPVLITDTCYQPTYFATTQPDYVARTFRAVNTLHNSFLCQSLGYQLCSQNRNRTCATTTPIYLQFCKVFR
jgi:hypothetical protein